MDNQYYNRVTTSWVDLLEKGTPIRYWDEKDNKYEIRVEVPGFSAEQVTATVEEVDYNLYLVVKAEKEGVTKTRRLLFPDDGDEEAIELVVKDGIVTVSVGKFPTVPPRVIKARSA